MRVGKWRARPETQWMAASSRARYYGAMGQVTACAVPQGSLLAGFGGPQDYRDCFAREVAGTVTLEQYMERFYGSMAFRPERMVLGLIGRGASIEDIRALASGETDSFAVWEVAQRSDKEVLLHSKDTGTASWLSIQPLPQGTRLLFGSWVGNLGQSWWRFMEGPHRMYSRALLGGV